MLGNFKLKFKIFDFNAGSNIINGITLSHRAMNDDSANHVSQATQLHGVQPKPQHVNGDS
jgi:hypothetical protein